MKTIIFKDNLLWIEFIYDPNLVNFIKFNFTGRKYHPAKKVWSVPINEKNIEKIYQLANQYKFNLVGNVEEEIEKYKIKIGKEKIVMDEKKEMSLATYIDIEIPGLKGELFPFQKSGVAFVEKTNGKALIADEMGLGKTAQSIAWCQLHSELKPILVVCPATLKLNWEREIYKWSDMSVKIIDSKDSLNYLIPKDVYIINYDILEKKRKELLKLNIKIMILDEAHYIKNAKAIRTKSIFGYTNKNKTKEIGLAMNIPHIIALTGTPILNKPIEIFNILRLIAPQHFGNFFMFARKFCNAKKGRWGWDFNGASNIEELADLLRSTVMVRREKKEVLPDLPDKLRTIIPQKINDARYKQVEDDLVNWLIENKNMSKNIANQKISGAEQLMKIEYCKQEAVRAKLDLFINWIKDFIEGGNRKLVVFGTHKEFISKIMDELKDYHPVKIVGGMSKESKQESVDTFQNNENCKLIICGIKAGGVGITLTASSHVAFYELGWTPGEMDQAEDRLHRIGQKDTVNCYYFIAENTIEEIIYDLIQSKREVFTKLMGDKNIIQVEKLNIFSDLLGKLTGG